jgi:hypothetical protein
VPKVHCSAPPDTGAARSATGVEPARGRPYHAPP